MQSSLYNFLISCEEHIINHARLTFMVGNEHHENMFRYNAENTGDIIEYTCIDVKHRKGNISWLCNFLVNYCRTKYISCVVLILRTNANSRNEPQSLRHYILTYNKHDMWQIKKCSPQEAYDANNTNASTGEPLEPEKNVIYA